MKLVTKLIAWLALHTFTDDQARQQSNKPQFQPPYKQLTRRERDILTLVAEGLSNKEIAQQLQLSEKTIRNRCSDMFNKLEVCNRTQATIWFREHNPKQEEG